MKIGRPVLRYHGGKYMLAPWIISNFPDHRIYVEGFGGGGSVLMQKKRCYAEVYNDKWDTVVNVFQVLRDPESAMKLKSLIELTPYSRSEFMKTGEIDLGQILDPIEKARLTIFRSFAGFGSASTNSKYATGFRSNSNRYGTTPAHDWVNYPSYIPDFVERLKGVTIENRHYLEVCRQHDSPQTLHFLDPPYVHATRNMERGNAAYEVEMTDENHVEMISAANELEGMVIISGYDSELYRDIMGDEWKIVTKDAYADGASKRVEFLYMNKQVTSKSFNILNIFANGPLNQNPA